MTLKEFQNRLQSETPTGVYFFCGEEAYLRRAYLTQLRKQLLTDPSLDSFNHVIYEGAEPNFEAIKEDMEVPPMLQDYKLIEWHSGDFTSIKEPVYKQFEELQKLQEQNPAACVVFIVPEELFSCGTSKRPTPQMKKLSSIISVIQFEKSTDAQLLNWIERHFAHDQIKTTPTVLRFLMDRVGHSMDILASEIDKLIAYKKAQKKDELEEQDVRYICTSRTEEDTFGLTNAIIKGNAEEAFFNLQDLAFRRVEITIVLGQLMKFIQDTCETTILMQEGYSQEDLAKALGCHSYVAGLYMKYVSTKSIASMTSLLSYAQEIDRIAKTLYQKGSYILAEKLLQRILAVS